MSKPPERVRKLLERYARESASLQSDAYGEADTRKEFIEPLFEALGWDVANRQGYSEAFKDVVNEYSLKVGGTYKAPDYAFRIGGTKQFFVEAKRPGVNIKTDSASAYQLRRYGWTAKLPISVLTNFRYIAIYDCAKRPTPTDKSSTARTLIIPWDELESRWQELENLLGKIPIQQGSLARYASAAGKRRGTTEVDDAFLEQMEHWRDDLARNIALRNGSITVDELNDSVQKTLDRIVFLRIAEDRGIEPYGALKDAISESGLYARLMTLFQNADTRYNSGLFHFNNEPEVSGTPDTLTPSLQIDDQVLRKIVSDMYYPTSPYEFSVFPSDILGQVYEQFLGKVIRLTPGHRARVEEKPEVKKAGGVFYTPTHIVDYIVEKTVAPALEGKRPPAALKVTIVDPACGSGTFLLGAYDYLLRWFLEAYKAGPAKALERVTYKSKSGERHLTLSERKRILVSCIHGVDIDGQAVEVTKLSLLLKVLEGENNETINQQMRFFHLDRVLPDLNFNIRCGNSLVATDVMQHLLLDPDEEDALNPFDWAKAFPDITTGGGFAVCIGNPPYDVLEKDRGKASWPHDRLREYLPIAHRYEPALGGKLNLYRLFLIRALELTRPGGHFGMIVPMSLLADISTASTRKHVVQELRDPLLDCFPQKDNPNRRIFRRAKLSTVVVTGRRDARKRQYDNIETRVFPANSLTDTFIHNAVTLTDCALIDPATTPIPLADSEEWKLCRSIHANSAVARLGDLTDSFRVTRGEINQTTYRRYIGEKANGHDELLKGVEIGTFVQRRTLSQGKREWFDGLSFRADYPQKPLPPPSRLAIQRITGVDERRRVVAAIVDSGAWFADSTNSIVGIEGSTISLEYLACLLNSDLIQWRFRVTSTNNNVGTNELIALPIRIPNTPSDVQEAEGIVRAGRRIIQLLEQESKARSASAADRLQSRIDSAWAELNRTVFDFYALSDDERGTVATRLARPAVGSG